MDFSTIFQLRTKKFWWMDVIFYFVVSLLIATVLSYLIFLGKNALLRSDIKKETAALQTVGTEQQKEYEKAVITYQKKFQDFSNLLDNHEFASNAFAFMQTQTMPNIWFGQFSLDEKNSLIRLSGESDDMEAFSRQVATLEQNKYVKSIGVLSSSLGDSSRIMFSINLSLDQKIFSYLSDMSSILQTTTSANQSPVQQNQTSPTTNGQPTQSGPISSGNFITSFHLILNPEVIGVVDETNYTVTLTVPPGTDVKNLMPSIVTSPNATISPSSTVQQDFTNPIIYTVTAQDGSAQNYSVKVTVATPAQAGKKSSQSGSALGIIILLVVIIIVATVVFLFAWRKIKSQKMGI